MVEITFRNKSMNYFTIEIGTSWRWSGLKFLTSSEDGRNYYRFLNIGFISVEYGFVDGGGNENYNYE